MTNNGITERLAEKNTRDKWIGIYIGIVAVVLAICSMGGGNAAKDATRMNIEAANTWAFFQAKNLRRTAVRLAAERLELELAAQANPPEAMRAAYAAKIKEYRDLAQSLTSDKKTNEGLDELFEKGKALEKERDTALRKDPYFDWSQALLQIAIVLATVCLVQFSILLMGMSGLLAASGVLLMLNGYTLAFTVPFIG